MESLESELALNAAVLAVTENSNRDAGKDASDGSESPGEFDGVIDSDGVDDDDANIDDIDDDDDDDDAEYGIDNDDNDDDDDDDYASQRKGKKKLSRPLKQKRMSSKSKSSSKSHSKQSDRKSGSRANRSGSLDDDDDDDDLFEYKFDQHGYGDSVDRDSLAKMNEVDRERLISERIDARNRKSFIWKKKRELARKNMPTTDLSQSRARSSGRSKQSSKSVALQALAKDKQRKKSSKTIDIGSDADSEQEQRTGNHRKGANMDDRVDSKPEAHLLKEDDGPELRYADLVRITDGIATTSPLFLRRDTLIKLSQQPFFCRVVEGLYVRLKIGDSENNEGSYLVCRIASVLSGNVYQLEPGVKTNLHLYLQSGKQRRLFEIRLISSSHPTEREFLTYVERAKSGGIEVARREEVDRLLKRSVAMIVKRKVTATEEERKTHMGNIEMVYPERVNWTQQRTEVETGLEVKRQELANAQENGRDDHERKYNNEVSTMEKRLDEIRKFETKYVLQGKKSNAEVFQNLARRNKKLNETNDSMAASRRNYESNKTSIDLFSRFDATGQSYFSIGDNDGTAVAMSEQARESHTLADWRKQLRTWPGGTAGKRRRISDMPLDAAYGVELGGLDGLEIDVLTTIAPKRGVSFQPPGMDAVYDGVSRHVVGPPTGPPTGAKIVSFEEWSKQRAA